MSVINDPDGEFIRYIVYSKDTIRKIYTPGIAGSSELMLFSPNRKMAFGSRAPYPCIPKNSTILACSGSAFVLIICIHDRLVIKQTQVKIKFYLNDSSALRYDTWIRLKVLKSAF